MKKVILLTGPGGAGKSTIAELLVNNYGYTLLDGDREDTEFFPDEGQWLLENRNKLVKAHDKILKKTKELVKKGNKIVVDYIIFGDYLNYFQKFKDTFGENLQIIVLFPSETETIDRDLKRECWTTGVDRIKAVRFEFENIREEIGSENFIDTSGETPQETIKKHFSVDRDK